MISRDTIIKISMKKTLLESRSHKQLHFKDYLDTLKSKHSPSHVDIGSPKHPPPFINKTMPRQEDPNQELLHLKSRYSHLQEKYKELLDKVRSRNLDFERMQEQINTYDAMHKRDTQQIEKLRCIIGLIKRKSAQTQVTEQDLQWTHTFRNSRSNKFDQSTEDDIKFKQSAEAFYPREQLSPKSPPRTAKELLGKDTRRSRQKTSQPQQAKGLLSQYQSQLRREGSRKKLSNSPYSQLRFIPGMSKK